MMYSILQVVTVCLVAVASALPLAHALELPGKMRLKKETYVTMQPIYYPGFTIGAGVGEGGGLIATMALLLMTPPAAREFWWTLFAFIALASMHAAYWIFTHPVNKFWLQDTQLQGFGRGFFAFDPAHRAAPSAAREDDWQRFRNRWEYSHVLRAVLAGASFIALVIAVAV